MELTRETECGQYQIKSFAPGELAINNHIYKKSLILTPRQIIINWPPQQLSELTQEHLQLIIALKPDIVLIGTGSQLIFPDTAILAPLMQAKIGYEIMDTLAACRTFTILAAEQRNVAVGLMVRNAW